MNTIEASVREIVNQVLTEREQSKPDYKSIKEFCTHFGMSRTAVWRGEKNGSIKITSIGGRKFIDINQFSYK